MQNLKINFAIAMVAVSWVLWRYTIPSGQWFPINGYERRPKCVNAIRRNLEQYKKYGYKIHDNNAEREIKKRENTYIISHSYSCFPSEIDPRPNK